MKLLPFLCMGNIILLLVLLLLHNLLEISDFPPPSLPHPLPLPTGSAGCVIGLVSTDENAQTHCELTFLKLSVSFFRFFFVFFCMSVHRGNTSISVLDMHTFIYLDTRAYAKYV